MKSFLEEYGFAIFAAIVVILLIAMTTPVGNSIKSYCLDLVSSFASTANKKLDMADGENSSVSIYADAETGIRGVITTGSTTDRFTYDVIYYSGGVEQKESYAGPEGETTTKEFEIAHSLTIDANSELHIIIKNLGTNEEISSNTIKIVISLDPVNETAVSESGGTRGSTLSAQDYADASDLIEGTIAKGKLIQIDNKEYRILNVDGTEIKVLAKYSVTEDVYSDDGSETTIDGKTVQKYENSTVDTYFNNYFLNSLSFKDAIVAKDIAVDAFDTNGTRYVGSSINRKVYLLSVQDIVDYGLSWDNINSGSDNLNTIVDVPIGLTWLRSAHADNSGCAFCIRSLDNISYLSWEYYYFPDGVRPAFVLDLTKIG